MGSRMPVCIFMLVALLAAWRHRQNIHVPQADSLRNRTEDVNPHVPQLGSHACLVAIHAARCPVRCRMHRADVRRHLMAACATLPILRRVVVRRTIGAPNYKQGRYAKADRHKPEEGLHDLNPVPFQLRTSSSDAM